MMADVPKKGYILVIFYLENSNTSSGTNKKKKVSKFHIHCMPPTNTLHLVDWLMNIGRQLAYFFIELNAFDWQVR